MSILDDIKYKFDGVGYGRYVMISCPNPKHSDHNPSCQVYEDRFRCLSCGYSGSTQSLLTTEHRSSFVSKRSKSFRNPFSVWLRHETLGQALKTAYELNKGCPSYYLKRRGIEPKDQIKLGIGTRDLWHTFPIRNSSGKVVGATARAGDTNTSPVRYVCPFGQDNSLLYIPDWSLEANKLYLTFGILDAVSLALLGLFAASTTTGKTYNASSLEWYKGNIIIIPDEGEQMAAHKLALSLGLRAKVMCPDYPVGTKDINDLYTRKQLNVVDGELKTDNRFVSPRAHIYS